MKLRRDGIPKALKWAVFERDSYTCRYCGARGVPMEADHVFPESKGGPTVLENLVTACEPCNRGKRDRLGIYPLPLDYLDKLNQAQAIINWYKDYQKELIKKEIDQKMLRVNALMDAELARVNRAFRLRQLVFLGIRAIPAFGILLVILASVWLFTQIYLINIGRSEPGPLMLAPYLVYTLSMLLIPFYKRALDWYCRLPYPRYESKLAHIEKEFSV